MYQSPQACHTPLCLQNLAEVQLVTSSAEPPTHQSISVLRTVPRSADGRHNRRVLPAGAAAHAIHRRGTAKEQRQMSSNRTANAVTCVLYSRPAIYRLLSCVLTLQLEPSAYRAGLDIILPTARGFPKSITLRGGYPL